MKKFISLFILLGISTSAFALFCPSGFNEINIGDSMEQVQQQCGKPDGIKKSKGEDKGPQEWNFYVNPGSPYTQQANSGQVATLKMAIAFNNQRVINITVNGMSLATTTICGKGVSVGDDMKSVKSACGDPVFINKSSVQNNEKPEEITEYKYNSTPPVVLIFENGKLQEKR